MSTQGVLAKIKSDLDSLVGAKVRLRAHRGRKRFIEGEGVLEGTYPHVFVVRLEEARNRGRRVSYSYTDVLTATVQLELATADQTGAGIH